MKLASRSKLDPFDFLRILPAIAQLVGDVVAALKDKKITKEEVEKIGADLIAIVGTVAD